MSDSPIESSEPIVTPINYAAGSTHAAQRQHGQVRLWLMLVAVAQMVFGVLLCLPLFLAHYERTSAFTQWIVAFAPAIFGVLFFASGLYLLIGDGSSAIRIAAGAVALIAFGCFTVQAALAIALAHLDKTIATRRPTEDLHAEKTALLAAVTICVATLLALSLSSFIFLTRRKTVAARDVELPGKPRLANGFAVGIVIAWLVSAVVGCLYL